MTPPFEKSYELTARQWRRSIVAIAALTFTMLMAGCGGDADGGDAGLDAIADESTTTAPPGPESDRAGEASPTAELG